MDEGNTYLIKEPSEDPYEVVITKTGITADFTPRDMVLEQNACEKVIKELSAKLAMDVATCENIEHHHAYVKQYSLEQLFTIHMYYESKARMESFPPKIKEMEAQLAASKAEQVKIAEALGLDILPKTPEQAVDAAVEKIGEGVPVTEEKAPEVAPSEVEVAPDTEKASTEHGGTPA